MLKQLQGLSKQDLKDKVWRPKLDDHWVYFMSLLQKLGKLESSSSYSSYVVESEEAEKKRKRKRSSSGGGNRSAKRKKMDKNMEFLDLIMSEQEMGDDEKKKIQLQNLRYVLEYLVGLFQENISYNPSREDNALHILLSCPSSAASSFGGNMEDRIRNLLDQVFFLWSYFFLFFLKSGMFSFFFCFFFVICDESHFGVLINLFLGFKKRYLLDLEWEGTKLVI